MKLVRSRRWVSGVAAGTAALTVLAACSSSPDAATGASGAGASGAAAPGSAEALDAALAAGGSITYWSWTPSAEAQVAAFEKAYPNVTVNYVNAGTGNDQYTKLQNAIKAGSGAPDVAQIEYQALPQFALTQSLVDLTQYGMADLKDDYTPSTWGAVNVGGGLFSLPQDSGPMAMFYNKEVFDKYDITVPTTWDEYVAAAEKLHTADPKSYIAADTGDAGFATSMIWQAGGKPFTTDGTTVSVNLQDDGAKKWTTVWNRLVEGKLLSTTPGWTDEWYKGLGDGSIATLLVGAWMPGVLTSSVPDGAGKWAVAPMPTYDGQPMTAENGGGGQSVLKQSANPALAAAFVRWLNSGDGVPVFLESGGFPATVADLQNKDFLAQAPKYFGGQKINEVLVDAASHVPSGWSYLPYQTYANSIFGDTAGKSYGTNTDLNAGLTAWQSALVEYGNGQGFTVNAG